MSTTKQTKVKQVNPLGDRILVRALETEPTSPGGIILAHTEKKEKPGIGTVISVGPGKRLDSGELIPVGVSVGDTVVFSKYSPDEIIIDGEELLVLREESILAVIK